MTGADLEAVIRDACERFLVVLDTEGRGYKGITEAVLAWVEAREAEKARSIPTTEEFAADVMPDLIGAHVQAIKEKGAECSCAACEMLRREGKR